MNRRLLALAAFVCAAGTYDLATASTASAASLYACDGCYFASNCQWSTVNEACLQINPFCLPPWGCWLDGGGVCPNNYIYVDCHYEDS